MTQELYNLFMGLEKPQRKNLKAELKQGRHVLYCYHCKLWATVAHDDFNGDHNHACEQCEGTMNEFKRKGAQPGNKNAAKGRTRIKHSPTLAPGSKELAQKIAMDQGWSGWGYALDEGLVLLADKLGYSDVNEIRK